MDNSEPVELSDISRTLSGSRAAARISHVSLSEDEN